MATTTPTGHQEDHISHENGQGHHHDHTGFENGVGHQKFHDLDDTGSPMEGASVAEMDIPVGHQEDHISHENGQGHQHDHIGYENGEGHQKFHETVDGPASMEGLFLSAEQTMLNDDDIVEEHEDDDMDMI